MKTTIFAEAPAARPAVPSAGARAASATAPDPSAVERVVADLARTVGSLRCAGSQRLVRMGISMTHFHVLTLLRYHDAMPMGRLAEILDVSMSNATGIIDRMEDRGLVERVRVPDDRRLVLVRPTRAGLDLVDEVELVRSEIVANALGRMTPAQVDGLGRAMADLQDAVEAELAGAPERYPGLSSCAHPHAEPHHRPAADSTT
jgi:DNA-binding MarR family transcriptional regulator